MARSRKHTPYFGICKGSTAKPYKQLANRHFRCMERAAVRAGRELPVTKKATADPRLMAYDDKRYWNNLDARLMRK